MIYICVGTAVLTA